MNMATLERALAKVKLLLPSAAPSAGLVLGSGLSSVTDHFETIATARFAEVPGLGLPRVAGHDGQIVLCKAAKMQVLAFRGRRHWYEGEGWDPVAIPIYVLKQLGARVVVLTNAAGGIRQDLRRGDIMMLDDHINAMGSSPLIGPHAPVWGPRFPDLGQVYEPRLRAELAGALRALAPERLKHGVYLAATGPTYETPSEIAMFRIMGADAVGMSTVPEAVLAHAAGLRVVALSCITNSAGHPSAEPITHDAVTDVSAAAVPVIGAALRAFFDSGVA